VAWRVVAFMVTAICECLVGGDEIAASIARIRIAVTATGAIRDITIGLSQVSYDVPLFTNSI
jgi:hypothetical protein